MRRRGLTLVEMLVALVITTLLAVAALRVVTTLARTEKVAQAIGEGNYLKNAIERTIAADVLGADHFRETAGGTAGGFALRTRLSLKAGTLAPEHLPSIVTYEVRMVGERPCLVRRQQTLAEAESVDLVATDVRGIRIAAEGPSRADAEGWKELTTAATVTVAVGKTDSAEFIVRKQ